MFVAQIITQSKPWILNPCSAQQSGVYSMNKTESQHNLSVRVNAAVELEAVYYLLNTYSSPCFGVKIVYNYGLW
jgi:hypothetical protein